MQDQLVELAQAQVRGGQGANRRVFAFAKELTSTSVGQFLQPQIRHTWDFKTTSLDGRVVLPDWQGNATNVETVAKALWLSLR